MDWPPLPSHITGHTGHPEASPGQAVSGGSQNELHFLLSIGFGFAAVLDIEVIFQKRNIPSLPKPCFRHRGAHDRTTGYRPTTHALRLIKIWTIPSFEKPATEFALLGWRLYFASAFEHHTTLYFLNILLEKIKDDDRWPGCALTARAGRWERKFTLYRLQTNCTHLDHLLKYILYETVSGWKCKAYPL